MKENWVNKFKQFIKFTLYTIILLCALVSGYFIGQFKQPLVTWHLILVPPIHKFDWRTRWLIIFTETSNNTETHLIHAHQLISVCMQQLHNVRRKWSNQVTPHLDDMDTMFMKNEKKRVSTGFNPLQTIHKQSYSIDWWKKSQTVMLLSQIWISISYRNTSFCPFITFNAEEEKRC